MSESKMTLQQAVESLNYFDLQAMKRHFNVTLAQAETQGDDFVYALVWVIAKREDSEVKPKDIQAMTMGDINNYFASEELEDPLEV